MRKATELDYAFTVTGFITFFGIGTHNYKLVLVYIIATLILYSAVYLDDELKYDNYEFPL